MIDGRRARARAARTPDLPGDPEPQHRGVGAWVADHGINADMITVLGIAFAAGTGVAIGGNRFFVAVVLLVVGGLMDTLDGIVAKAAGTASARGAFFDSVADRVSDGLIFGGLSYYFLDGRDPRLALLPIAIFGVAATVSYERAKAESLGFTARGGLMERAERLILVGVALLAHVLLVPVLIALLVLTSMTAIGRFVRVWGQASGEQAGAAVRSEVWKAEIDARWRRWRTAARARSVRRNRREVSPLSTRLRGVLVSERGGTTQRGEHRERKTRARRLQPRSIR